MHSQHGSTTLQALYQVFVLPALTKPLSRLHLTRRILPALHPARPFSHTATTHAKTRAPERRQQKWDAEITHQLISLVDADTHKLSAPRTKFDILRSLDRTTHRLVQLSPDEPGNPNFVPVCKIVSKRDAYVAERRRREAQRDAKRASARSSDEGMKTLEINWAIDGNDLSHRLHRIRRFLAEGRRVEVVLAGKKGGRKASRDECEGVLRRIREAVQETEGARERREMEGKIGGFATLMFQGPMTGLGKVVAGVGEEGDGKEGD